MKILARIRQVMLAPRACWAAIAAEGDATRWLWRRYLPALILPGWLAGLVLAAFTPAEEAAVRQTAHYRQQADGSMELVATGESVSVSSLDPLLGALLALPLSLLLAFLGVLVLRSLVLWRAPRFGAARDRAAATSLVIHAGTPAWLATVVPLPWIGDLLGLAGAVMGLVLLWHGAPRMLPPDPGRERAIGWSAVWMALLSVAILLVIGLVGVFTLTVAMAALLTSFAAPG